MSKTPKNAAGVNSEVGQAEILDPSAPAAPEASVVVPRDELEAAFHRWKEAK